jgi:hypothetical protein
MNSIKIKTEDRKQIELDRIDGHNEICVEVVDKKYHDRIDMYLNIEQTIEVIKFLQEQVETFNNKKDEKI